MLLSSHKYRPTGSLLKNGNDDDHHGDDDHYNVVAVEFVAAAPANNVN